MKKIIYLTIAVFYTAIGNCQPFPLDTVFVSEQKFDYYTINVCDSIYAITRNNSRIRERENVFIVTPTFVDTLNINPTNRPIIFEGSFYFDNYASSKIWHIWSYSDGLKKAEFENRFSDDPGGEYIITITGNTLKNYKLELYNPITRETTFITKLNDLPLPSSDKYSVNEDWDFMRPFIIDKDKIILGTAFYYFEIEENFYFLKNNNITNPINDIINTNYIPLPEGIIISNNRNVISIELRENTRLFKNTLEPLGDILKRKRPSGLNMQNGKFSGYFILSQLDSRGYTYATFYYELNPTLELAMYKAYHDGILTSQDIKGLNKRDLGILRNLLFAKHNYQFDSLYYQAYFSSLTFYLQLSLNPRTKDIAHLLTEADKANIALIRAAEEKAQQ